MNITPELDCSEQLPKNFCIKSCTVTAVKTANELESKLDYGKKKCMWECQTQKLSNLVLLNIFT